MIPRSQHFGDRAPFPIIRPGVVRIFEETVFKRFLISALRRAHYLGQQANASVENDQSARFSARKDIVADRHRADRSPFEQAFVEFLRNGRRELSRPVPRRARAPAPGSTARRAASSPEQAHRAGARSRHRPRAPARRHASPSPPRRPTACHRRSCACRWRNRGSGSHRTTICLRRARARRYCGRAARETSRDRASGFARRRSCADAVTVAARRCQAGAALQVRQRVEYPVSLFCMNTKILSLLSACTVKVSPVFPVDDRVS